MTTTTTCTPPPSCHPYLIFYNLVFHPFMYFGVGTSPCWLTVLVRTRVSSGVIDDDFRLVGPEPSGHGEVHACSGHARNIVVVVVVVVAAFDLVEVNRHQIPRAPSCTPCLLLPCASQVRRVRTLAPMQRRMEPPHTANGGNVHAPRRHVAIHTAPHRPELTRERQRLAAIRARKTTAARGHLAKTRSTHTYRTA